MELNHRHTDFQSVALPTELPRHKTGSTGFEPAVSSVTGWRVKPLHHDPINLANFQHYPYRHKWAKQDLNL
jgi:hypothetical protein